MLTNIVGVLLKFSLYVFQLCLFDLISSWMSLMSEYKSGWTILLYRIEQSIFSSVLSSETFCHLVS